jgi:hypothetical protein
MWDTLAVVDGCDAIISYSSLLSGQGDPDTFPTTFDKQVALVGTKEVLEVEPGETATIPFTFTWNAPEDTPPILAICRT